MPRIYFSDESFIEVPRGTNLLSAIVKAGKPIGNSCSAIGICAKCVVEVLQGEENLSKPNPIEKKLVAREKIEKGRRVSCLVKVLGDIKITTGYW